MSIQEILREAEKMSNTDKWQLVRHLLDELQETNSPSQDETWESFVNRMYGALADDPIERLPQLPLTERDPID